jgi:hypothetical protein
VSVLPVFAEHLTALDRPNHHAVLKWACPVPHFGGTTFARFATVGINPSNLEFVDAAGVELNGRLRRLPTLHSLGLVRWADADGSHLRQIASACDRYFRVRPYDRWFGVLNRVLEPAGVTFYGDSPTACHLDLVPYTTTEKWGKLSARDRSYLLNLSREAFALLVRAIPVEVLLLNGSSVVRAFEEAAGEALHSIPMPDWDLDRPASRGGPVRGTAYFGSTSELASVPLDRTITVIGFNHNLQSSFGVTGAAVAAIGQWVSQITEDTL